MKFSPRYRRIAWIVGSVVAAALIAGGVIWGYSLAVASVIRGGIAEIFSGVEYSVGKVTFDPFGSEVVVSRIAVLNPRGYASGRRAIVIGEIRARLNAPALLRHVVHLRELRIRQCELMLEFREIPTSLVDWALVAFRGPGINLYEIMTAENPQAPPKSARGETARRKWFYRVDSCEITGCRVFFGNLDQLRGIAELAAEKFFDQSGEPESSGVKRAVREKAVGMAVKAAVAAMLRSARSYFRDGVALPDYRLPKPVGQNDASSARDVAEEIFRNHWEEITDGMRNCCGRFQEQCLEKLRGIKKRFLKTFEKRKEDPAPEPSATETAASAD